MYIYIYMELSTEELEMPYSKYAIKMTSQKYKIISGNNNYIVMTPNPH